MIYTPPHLDNVPRWAGLRIGLLGGSFNPPHAGHVHISHLARKMLRLDAVWWLVTPQNPLKSIKSTAPFDRRFEDCLTLTAPHPHLIVSNLESQMGLNRSYDTLSALRGHFPLTDFVWITGMDNALTFHTWYRWRDILDLMATAHIARPPFSSLVRHCPLRLQATQTHVVMDRARPVVLDAGHSYWIMQRKMIDISSTYLRTQK